ncbi:MAG TPA: hydantoinase B/oxoprolinase family protein [bacterium]|nr:hydantoinase B/oxoprolinase family protein [bacterium]
MITERTTNPVMLEVLRNRFQAIAEEMASLVLRAGHTVFVKETSDFGAALVSTRGEVVCAPVNTGVALMVGVPCDVAIERAQDLGVEPGDVFISNDVWGTGGMATHLPDIYVWKPIFHEGQVICYAWAFVHSSDVGGIVPGSIAPSSNEIYQEGIRIPVSKLFRCGELNRELLNLIMANCRIPDQNWGDIKAMVSGLTRAEQRVEALVDRYGVETVRAGIVDVLDYAEEQAREEFAKVPDGTYVFWDYMEGDSGGGRAIRMKVRMVVDGGGVTLDFSDTDPQTRQSYNLPSHSRRGHWQFVFSLVGFLRSVRAGITYNSGLARPVALEIPRGSVLNPEPGVSVGNRSATQIRLVDVIMGALAQARPETIPAAGAGQGSIFLLRVPDPNTGQSKVSVIQPLCGGSGGRPTKDGIDGIDFSIGYLRNIPVESIEADMPVRIRRYRLREDSGGAGRFRGGVGLEIEMQVLAPEATVTSRAMDRYNFRPWGRLGGRPGARGYTLLNPGTPAERSIGKIDVLQLEYGDVIRIGTPGGGGYGDPLERDPADVAADVRRGVLSANSAAREYDVVLRSDATVDDAATQTRRAARRAARGPLRDFDFGPEREEYERVWSDTLVTGLVRALDPYPPKMRTLLRERVCRAIDAETAAGRPVTVDDLARLLGGILESVGYTAKIPAPAG